MKKIKGRLLYKGWFNLPWEVVSENGEIIDLWPIVHAFLLSLDGRQASQDFTTVDSYALEANQGSGWSFHYIPGESLLLRKVEGFGFDNVHAWFEMLLTWLSGRLVDIEVEDGVRMKIVADADEEVLGLHFTRNNSCAIPHGAEKTICKAGQSDCCIFICSGASGFTCEKFNGPLARTILDRFAKGEMRASRIGNCAIRARREPPSD